MIVIDGIEMDDGVDEPDAGHEDSDDDACATCGGDGVNAQTQILTPRGYDETHAECLERVEK